MLAIKRMKAIAPLISKTLSSEFLLFCLVGVLCLALITALFQLFHRVAGLAVEISIAIAFVITTIANYWLNKNLSFKDKRESTSNTKIRYFMLIVVNFLSVEAIAFTFVAFALDVNYLSLTTSIVCMAQNYLLMKNFVFKK